MARTVCISWLICKASQNGIVVKNAERCSIQKQIYFSIPQNYRSHADLRHFEQHNNLKGTSAQHLSELSLQINPRKLFCVCGWCGVMWCGVVWCGVVGRLLFVVLLCVHPSLYLCIFCPWFCWNQTWFTFQQN